MNIDEIETVVRETAPVAFATFSASRNRPAFVIERLDKKEIRPGSMQMTLPTVKLAVTVGDLRPYLLYTQNSDDSIQRIYFNGLSRAAGKLGPEKPDIQSPDDITPVQIQMGLAEFAATVVGPLTGA